MLNRSALNESLREKPECLTPEQLEACATNPAMGHPHLAECPRCQAQLALLKSFESSDPLPDEGAAVTWISARLERQLDQIKNPGRSRAGYPSQSANSWLSLLFGGGSARWIVPVAAGLLLIAVASLMLSHRPEEPQLRADAGSGTVIYRSQEVELAGPAGELPEAPKVLQWKTFSGSASYKVSVMEIDEVPLWSGQTSDLFVTIPNAIRAKMLPGKPVLWRVTALDSQGRVLATSQLQRFSVQRKSSASNSGVLPQ